MAAAKPDVGSKVTFHSFHATAIYVDPVRDYAPDMVVDSFEPIACLAARVAKVPLATVLQGNIHPASRGFHWWRTCGLRARPAQRHSSATLHPNMDCRPLIAVSI